MSKIELNWWSNYLRHKNASKEMSSLKGEIVAMNKKLDQRFEQLMKLHEDTSRYSLLVDENNKVPAEKSSGSSTMADLAAQTRILEGIFDFKS